MVHHVRGVLELARGRYQDALAAFRAAERLAGHLAAPHLLVPPTRGLLLHVLVHLGEIERAEQALAELGGPDRERGETRTALAALRLASEIRVLRYLPTNLSTPEIANELHVSRNTIRTHTSHLYAKLGTHRRTEAVERARALGLLAPLARRR